MKHALTRPLRTLRALLCVVVFGLLLGACACSSDGGDAASSDETPVGDSFEAMLVNDLSLTTGEARCVTSRVEALLNPTAVQQVVRGEADAQSQTVFDQVLGACAFEAATPANSLVRRPGEPFTYGDDAELDRLWDQCAEVGTDVCDQLFNQSPEGSEYEAFANSCGGRGPQVACAPGSTGSAPGRSSSSDPTRYGDDPTLDGLWDQCASGDDQACLALEFQASPGSEYASFAASCGGRPDGCADG